MKLKGRKLVGSVIVVPPNGLQYTLTAHANVSIGIYTLDNKLVRRLIENEYKLQGTHSFSWDGKLDDLITIAPDVPYKAKIVAGQFETTWAVIGNTSSSFTGYEVHRTFKFFCDILAVNDYLVNAADYAERESSMYKIMQNNIQEKIDIFPHNQIQQITNSIATDGLHFYFAGLEYESQSKRPDNNAPLSVNNQPIAPKSYVGAVKLIDITNNNKVNLENSNHLKFQSQTVMTYSSLNHGCDIVSTNSGPTWGSSNVTALAVQPQGMSYIFTGRYFDNTLRVTTKPNNLGEGGGVFQKEFTFIRPVRAKCDSQGNLWLGHKVGSEYVVQKFAVSGTGAGITLTPLKTITGITALQGFDLSPDETKLSVMDCTSTGDFIKTFAIDGSNTNEVWRLGRAESYRDVAKIYPAVDMPVDEPIQSRVKFHFRNIVEREDIFSNITYQADGSFWVIDRGLNRLIKFDTNRNYVDEIAFLPAVYSVNSCYQDRSRLFANFFEYSVDDSKTLLPGNTNDAWRMTHFWGANIPDEEIKLEGTLLDPFTTSGGKTFAIQVWKDGANSRHYVVELVQGGTLRYIDKNTPLPYTSNFDAEGNMWSHTLYWITLNPNVEGGKFIKRPFITVTNGNPVWGPEEIVATYKLSDGMKQAGPQWRHNQVTESGYQVVFNGINVLDDKYRLGAIKHGAENNKFLWKAVEQVEVPTPEPDFPTGSAYPIQRQSNPSRGVEYAGNIALALGKFILWGYNGEFWVGITQGQTNYWTLMHECGLFLYRFGVMTDPTQQAQARMAGNAVSAVFYLNNGKYQIKMNDESFHGGISCFEITGLDDVQEYEELI